MITRRSRNLLSLGSGALILASIPFPSAFSHSYWTGTNPVGLAEVRWWSPFLGTLIVGAVLLEFRRGISTRLVLITAGAVGVWEFVGTYMRLRPLGLDSFDAVTYRLGPGLAMAALGAGIALIVGAVAIWVPDPAPISEVDVAKKGANRAVKAVSDFHEHRPDF